MVNFISLTAKSHAAPAGSTNYNEKILTSYPKGVLSAIKFSLKRQVDWHANSLTLITLEKATVPCKCAVLILARGYSLPNLSSAKSYSLGNCIFISFPVSPKQRLYKQGTNCWLQFSQEKKWSCIVPEKPIFCSNFLAGNVMIRAPPQWSWPSDLTFPLLYSATKCNSEVY